MKKKKQCVENFRNTLQGDEDQLLRHRFDPAVAHHPSCRALWTREGVPTPGLNTQTVSEHTQDRKKGRKTRCVSSRVGPALSQSWQGTSVVWHLFSQWMCSWSGPRPYMHLLFKRSFPSLHAGVQKTLSEASVDNSCFFALENIIHQHLDTNPVQYPSWLVESFIHWTSRNDLLLLYFSNIFFFIMDWRLNCSNNRSQTHTESAMPIRKKGELL